MGKVDGTMLKVIGIVVLLTIRANSSPVDRSRLGKSLWPFVASDSPGSKDGESLQVWKFISDDGHIPPELLDLQPANEGRIWRVKIPAIDPNAMQPEVDNKQSLAVRQDDEFSGYFIGPVVPVSLDRAITSTEAVDLSFLDDLGGLAPFLPDPHQDSEESFVQLPNSTGSSMTSSRQDSQASPSYSFFRWLLSKLTFGLVGETPASSRSPAPATYHPPKTKSTYIAYRLPVNEASEITIMKTGHRASGISADAVEPEKAFVYSQDTERRSVRPNPEESIRTF